MDSPFESTTLVELLCRRALQHPERRSYTFLIDGELEGAHLTYGALNRKARAIGALLQQRVRPGARALLVYPSDLEFITAFFGCLYAGVIAVPTYPPQTRTKRSLTKLQAIMHDVQPAVVLTIASLSSTVESLFSQAQELQPTPLLNTDDIDNNLADTWQDPAIDGNTLAFLQYTSGSTGMPRGVMLTHSNLLHNSSLMHSYLEPTSASLSLSWLPLYHDMGLIGAVLQALYIGCHTTIMSPVALLQRPIRWLQAISDIRANISGGPNFVYDLCVRKITPEQKAGLDLSSWDLAFNGAEPIRQETMQRFIEAFAPCGFRPQAFYPCYGLAEATLMVSASNKAVLPIVCTVQAAALEENRVVIVETGNTSSDREHPRPHQRTLVGCGRISQKVVIVNPDTCTQCPPDHIGEIWVCGPSVAQGYWQKPEETERTFHAYLVDTKEGPFLRTGDLGFLQDGELFVTGRLKDLIIIRGRNHYPQDIERTVEQSHPALRPSCGVAFSVDVSAEERLVIVQEVERQYKDLHVDDVVETMRQAVAEQHELQIYAVVLVKIGSIPKTSSGKLQRRACREGYLTGTLNVIGEWTNTTLDNGTSGVAGLASATPNPQLDKDTLANNGRHIREELLVTEPAQRQALLEDYISEKIATALRLSLARLNAQQPLNSLGIDSLTAMELKTLLEEELKVEVPITIFLQEPTIAQFATQLLDQLTGISPEREHQFANTTNNVMNPQDAEQLLAELDQLSDEEVDSLLSHISQEENGHIDGVGARLIAPEIAKHLLAGIDELSNEEVDSLLSRILEEESSK